MDTKEVTLKICKAASKIKAENIIVMNMQGIMFSTEYFVVCNAATATQVRAIADNIDEELLKDGLKFNHREGYREAEWILLDYGDVVAHIFKTESRDYYALEKLWGDAEIEPYKE